MFIYHIVESQDLLRDDYYEPKSLIKDGFIHMSFDDQYIRVAESLYLDYDTLHLLEIDTELLEDKEKLVVEDLYNLNETFPHLYDRLNMKSVVNTYTLRKKNKTFIKENNNE